MTCPRACRSCAAPERIGKGADEYTEWLRQIYRDAFSPTAAHSARGRSSKGEPPTPGKFYRVFRGLFVAAPAPPRAARPPACALPVVPIN
jgi:hypothetical protein